MITEEIKNKNYRLYLNKLINLGINVDVLDELYGEKITNATFAIQNDYGCAYDGSLLQIILRVLTPIALKLNEILPEDIRVDNNSIIKVCLLQHLAKCEIFEKNDNQWEIEKRGLVYKYKPQNVALKIGAKSLSIAMKTNIQLTEEEFEAIISMDRNENDNQLKYHSSILSMIIKQANELTYIQIKHLK